MYFNAKVKVGVQHNQFGLKTTMLYLFSSCKIYNERTYNHFAVKLNKDLRIIDVSYKPLIPAKIGYALFFITRWFNKSNVVMVGG